MLERRALIDPMPDGPRRGRVIGRRALSPHVTELVLELEGESRFHWLAGQHVTVRPEREAAATVAFSLASAPDPERERHVTLAVRNGSGAELLAYAVPGAALVVDGPFGSLTWRDAPCALLCGAGTGIAPLYALAHAALAAGGTTPIVLLAGNRTRADRLWDDELSELMRRHPYFAYEPVLSAPDPGWTGRRGHVQAHLSDVVPKLPPGARVYLCGSSSMVNDCERRLSALGVPPERILSEAYG